MKKINGFAVPFIFFNILRRINLRYWINRINSGNYSVATLKFAEKFDHLFSHIFIFSNIFAQSNGFDAVTVISSQNIEWLFCTINTATFITFSSIVQHRFYCPLVLMRHRALFGTITIQHFYLWHCKDRWCSFFFFFTEDVIFYIDD